ncbi:MAG: hypothetical protein ABL955_02345, partial [Elusimicrobiota bacterium]
AATAENSDRKKLISAFSELLPGGAADPRNLGFIRWAFRLIQRPQTGEFRPLRIAKAIRKH